LLYHLCVGKSGLSLVLTEQHFVPTESTHGRHVWTFDNQVVELDNSRKETRDTILWDLAGQPGYRLIHQLHLNEVAVALVLFDARNETDPFAGVYHWDRALRLAQHVQGNSALPLKKFLVAARVDRGGKGVSHERIESLVRSLGFDGYFETSAKEGKGITELVEAIKQGIDWSVLPRVTSNDLFQQIKDFLISEKEVGHLLSTIEDLYRTFLKTPNAPADSLELRAQFETCIGRVESRDLIRRLSFGNLVLLRPELLDSYASALVNAVKDEPDGLGSIAEEKARTGSFSVPRDERLKDKEQEKVLLIAMVEDLLRHEIVLREQADDGTYLVFPSQSTRENPDLPDPEGKAVIFDFEGPVQNIFATLAVRLSHSGLFKKNETWKDAVTFTSRVGGSCGLFLHNIGEGHAELTLFYEKTMGGDTPT
jgi:GTPase SAR1 family protein